MQIWINIMMQSTHVTVQLCGNANDDCSKMPMMTAVTCKSMITLTMQRADAIPIIHTSGHATTLLDY